MRNPGSEGLHFIHHSPVPQPQPGVKGVEEWLLYQSNVGLSGLLCLCPSQALGQERGVCSRMWVGTHIPVYACTCGSSLRTHPEAAAWVLVGTESCAFKCYSKATPLFFSMQMLRSWVWGPRTRWLSSKVALAFLAHLGPKGSLEALLGEVAIWMGRDSPSPPLG